MKKFKINTVSGWEEVDGEIIELPGIKKYVFFICFFEGTWRVSEKSTGFYFSESKNKKTCIKVAKDIVKKRGQKGFDKAINYILKKRNDPFEKAINESGITMTEGEKADLKNALKKYKLIK